jgi:hypothetical protein
MRKIKTKREYSVTIESSLKSDDQGARTASFGIIGHQTRNWE